MRLELHELKDLINEKMKRPSVTIDKELLEGLSESDALEIQQWCRDEGYLVWDGRTRGWNRIIVLTHHKRVSK